MHPDSPGLHMRAGRRHSGQCPVVVKSQLAMVNSYENKGCQKTRVKRASPKMSRTPTRKKKKMKGSSMKDIKFKVGRKKNV